MDKLINEFTAQSDSGKEYKVFYYKEQIDTGMMDNRNRSSDGMESYKLSSGEYLKPIDAESFEIVGTSEIIRKL